MNQKEYAQRIRESVCAERLQKKPLNMRLLDVCMADVIDYQKAEELLLQGAEPLGYVEECGDGDWPNNLYTQVVWHLYHGMETKEDYYDITELFLRYGMDISKPSIPYDGDNILNPIGNYGGVKNDCMMRTMRLLLDHGLSADDAEEGWGGQISDFINCTGIFSDEVVQLEFPYYVRMLMLIASYPHILDNDPYLQAEIWYQFNQGRCDLQRFREWDWYDIDVDTSRCGKHPCVARSVVTLIDKKSAEKVWKFGIILSPEDVSGD